MKSGERREKRKKRNKETNKKYEMDYVTRKEDCTGKKVGEGSENVWGIDFTNKTFFSFFNNVDQKR